MSTGVIVTPARGRTLNPPLILAALMVVIASFQLQATMLSPAIADMAARLQTNAGVIGWSSTVFLAVSAGLAIFFPPLADKIGRRKVLLLSVALMTLGTLLVLVTNSVLMLMIGRALQGFCGATFALANLTLRSILDPKRYGFYISLVGAINSGVAGIDTLLGGMIVDAWSYKGIFLVILILEAAALAMVLLFVPETTIPAAARMDWAGAITVTASLWSLNMALTLGFGTYGWSHPWTLILLAAGLVLMVVFLRVEKHAPAPLIPLAELRQRATLGQLGTTFFALASAFSVLIYLVPTIALDPVHGFGMSGTRSALMYLTPFSLLGWALSPLVGKIAPRVGYRLVLRVGLTGSAAMLACMWAFGMRSPWLLFALALGMGASWAAMSSTCLNALGVLYASPHRPGVLPGLNSAAFNLGAGVGIGVMASIVAGASTGDAVAGYRAAMLVGLLCALLSLGCSMLLPGRENEDEKI
ncbi:MFS transporter [Gephyromycinifex aptenodytis]|uniref:MFS transporter n=1 Tax=Gephyromycinifex aptenodytis TaxID=2716227 RepID=UPI001447A2D3|nr:MFS transporter [Gephyromycinifex aptenodytis]